MLALLDQQQFAPPDPGPNPGPSYRWSYRFSHTIAGYLTTAFGSRIPGLTRIGLVLLLLLSVSTTSCAAHYTVHPGALNQTDSVAYDALRIAETTIDQARLDLQAGQLPPEAKDALEELIRVYNVARASWLTYRAAIASAGGNPVSFDQLSKNLADLSNAIWRLEQAR